jgi:hypothetical protein
MILNQYIDSPSWQLDYSGKPTAKKKRLRPYQPDLVSHSALKIRPEQDSSLLMALLRTARAHSTTIVGINGLSTAEPGTIPLELGVRIHPPGNGLSTPKGVLRPFNTKAQGTPDEALHTAWSGMILLRQTPSRLAKFAETNI